VSAVRDRLRDQPLPGEADAAARTWPVVEAALAERRPARRTRGLPLRVALVAALLGAGLLTALSPAGAWIGDRFARDDGGGAPAFAGLPDGGSVLAISRSGAYAVHADGGSRRLGSFTDASWSPHGLHVVGADGRRVVAVDAAGTLKWALTRRRRVHHPSWSLGEGFAVAYLEGRTLRAVAGNGDPATERRLRRGAAAVTPAWRPGSDRVLAYATSGGAVEAIDTETGRTLWGTELRARALAWTRDRRRLVALSPHAVTVLDASGRAVVTRRLPGVARELALHPDGSRAAVVTATPGETRVLEVPLGGEGSPRRLFQGNVDGLAWSADGRHLLVGWRAAGQWLVIGPGDRVRALHDVSLELGAAGGFPRVGAWCCPSGR
jgi:hypothetical protein